MEANSLVGLARHATGDVHTAVNSADAAQALADHTDPRRRSLSQHQDVSIPCALHRIAALRFATVGSLIQFLLSFDLHESEEVWHHIKSCLLMSLHIVHR